MLSGLSPKSVVHVHVVSSVAVGTHPLMHMCVLYVYCTCTFTMCSHSFLFLYMYVHPHLFDMLKTCEMKSLLTKHCIFLGGLRHCLICSSLDLKVQVAFLYKQVNEEGTEPAVEYASTHPCLVAIFILHCNFQSGYNPCPKERRYKMHVLALLTIYSTSTAVGLCHPPMQP